MMLAEKTKCCGCAVCVDVCPNNFISMEKDGEGFLYPVIDDSKCLNCGLCKSKCPVLSNEIEKEKIIPEAYGIKAKDTELRLASSSGGMFSIIANHVLSEGGIVCGAAMANDCKSVEHILVDKQEDLYKLRGSKYVQSKIGNTYRKLESELKKGRKVLFSGTPCQVSGFRSFLGKDYDNLLLVEVICHGVPSPDLWVKYIDDRERKTKAQIVKVDFRHKKRGWTVFGSRLENSQRKVLYSTLREDPYLLMFLGDYCLRPSCYSCNFKGFKVKTDFTLGDFWGIQSVVPEFFDDKGVSLVLVHSEKAKTLFKKLANLLDFVKVDCMTALKHNIVMIQSVKKPVERDKFFEDMNKMDFDCLTKKYASVRFKQKLINRLEMYGLLDPARKLAKAVRPLLSKFKRAVCGKR